MSKYILIDSENYNENQDYFDLEQENKQLKEKYENVLIANRKLIKEIDDYQNIIIKIKEQNKQLKERIDKAIEYMQDYCELVVPDANIKSLILKEEYKKIIEILGDKEWN